jgi:hypothetical protein
MRSIVATSSYVKKKELKEVKVEREGNTNNRATLGRVATQRLRILN